MEASNTPIEVTSSRSAPQTARGRHVFEIAGYSLQKDGDLGVGKFIKSAAFAVGGHYWRIRFYPDVLVGEDRVRRRLPRAHQRDCRGEGALRL